MDLARMEQRSECCILIRRMQYPWNITETCQDEGILLRNLKTLENSGVWEVLKSLDAKNMAAILQHGSALPRMISLLEADVSVHRINRLISAMPVDEIMAYDEGDIRDMLLDLNISDGCMDLYLKYYRTDGLTGEELENLCAGLAAFRSLREHLTDEWLGEIRKKRMIFASPVLSSWCMRGLKDYDRWVQLLAENGDLFHILEELYEGSGGSLQLDDGNMEELSSDTQHITELFGWARTFFSTQQLPVFLDLWTGNHALAYDLGFLKRKAEAGGPVNVDALLTGRASYIAFIYNTVVSAELSGVHEELMIYAVVNKKKAFVKLVLDNLDLYRSISGRSILFYRDFYDRCVNINTLNKKNLEDCINLLDSPGISWELIADCGYTFNEVALIYALPKEYLQLYGYFLALRTDERLRIMREVVRKQCLHRDMDLAGLAKVLMKKPLSQWMQHDLGHISGLTDENAIRLLCGYETLERFIPDMKSNAEVRYVLKNIDKIDDFPSLPDMYQHAVEHDDEWRSVADLFGYTEEFITDNRARIIDFILHGGAHIIMTYHKCNSDKQDMLRRLVNAELIGRFKDMKYHCDDLVKEIDHDITDGQKNAWIQNTRINSGDLSLWEEDGLIPVMLIGDVPMHTCLSYDSGAYNQCLLACHDSNKKILNMAYNGKIVMRAAIRLTKGTFQDIGKTDAPRLEFADLLAEDGNTEQDEDKVEERLTLFVERAYIAGLPEEMEKKACEMVLKLMRQKAMKLNAQLAASMSYKEQLQGTLVPAYYSIYISRSKAGEQYLDSMGGSNGIHKEGRYYRGKYLVDIR